METVRSQDGPQRTAARVRELWLRTPDLTVAELLRALGPLEEGAVADAIAADAQERLARGLDAAWSAYVRADPKLGTDAEARRAVVMCHATARPELSVGALREYLLTVVPGFEADVNAVMSLASVLREAVKTHEGTLHPGERLGKYELREALGSGSFGDVWRAWDVELQRYVALKVLKPGGSARSQRRFEAEACAAAAIHHENVVAVHDAGLFAENGRAYIDAQLAGDPEPTADDPRAVRAARSLAEVVASPSAAMQWRDVARIGAAVARGVAAAHARGVLHRDIKPANILITARGTPMIADFGLSVSSVEADAPGHVVGTPAFMAPEQAAGAPSTPLTDVYSIGVTLAYLLTGESSARIEPQHRAPSELIAIIARATAEVARDRYISAEQLARDLDALLANRPTLAAPPSALRACALWYRRNAKIASVAAVMLLVGAAAGVKSIERIVSERNRAVAAEQNAERQRQVAERSRAIAEATNKFMVETLGAAIPLQGRPEVSLRAAMTMASETASPDLDPEVLASVKFSIGRTLTSLGVFDRAKQDLEQSLSIRERLLGARHRDTLLVRHALATLDVTRARFAQGGVAFEALLKDATDALSPEDPLIAAILDMLGQCRRVTGDLAGAREALERALDMRTRLLGADNGETLATLRNLGGVYARQKEPELAAATLTRAYERTRERYGPDHHLTSLARQDLGAGLRELGRLKEAQEHLDGAYTAFLTRLGAGHFNTVVAGSNLASVRFALADYAGALEVLDEFLPEAREKLGEQHPNVLRARNTRCAALAGLGRFDETERELESVLKEARAAGAPGRVEFRAAAANLARVLDRRGERERAARLREEAEDSP